MNASPEPHVSPPRILRIMPWVLAAVLLLVVMWQAAQILSLRSANQTLQTQQQLADLASANARHQLAERSFLAEAMINDLGQRLGRADNFNRLRIATLLPSTNPMPSARAVVVWDAEQQNGLLLAEHMPPLPSGHAFHLWILDRSSPEPIHCGVLTGSARIQPITPSRPVATPASFAISTGPKESPADAGTSFLLAGPLSANQGPPP